MQSHTLEAPESTNRLDRFPYFDWLRFALAVAVLFSHSGIVEWENAGNLAVQIFFSLSGWLIGGILVGGRAKDLPRFYFKRATRIWAPYFFSVVVLYIISAVRDPITWHWFRFLIYDVTFTHNWFSLWPDAATALAEMPQKGTGNHFWSIAVEEQFYLIAPLIIYSSRAGRSPILWAGLLVGLIAFNQLNFASVTAGVAAASANHKWKHWYRAPLSISLFGAVLIVTGVTMYLHEESYDVAAPLFSVAIVLLLAVPGKSTSLGLFAGAISYPIYLNAWIGVFVGHAITRHLIPSLGQFDFPIAVTSGILAGVATYIVVDRNVMARRSGWYTERRGIILAATAYALLLLGLAFGAVVVLRFG